jgi:hypothetical protein
MALAVKQYEALDPLQILRFCTDAVVFDPDFVMDLIEQFGRIWNRRCICACHHAPLFDYVRINRRLTAEMSQIIHPELPEYTPSQVSTFR